MVWQKINRSLEKKKLEKEVQGAWQQEWRVDREMEIREE